MRVLPATKEPNQWSEAAVYRVKGDRITEVRFYYKPPPAERRYDLFCLARDTAGNAEVQVPTAEATTVVNLSLCRSPGKSSLVLKNNAKDKKDSVVWKWLKGEATTKEEYGMPTVDTPYDFLIRSGAGSFSAVSLSPGTLWKDVKKNGFKYADKLGANGRIVKTMLKPGAADKAQVVFGGKGVGLS